MDNELQQQLKNQFQSLPPEVQQAILTIDLSGKLQEVVKNNKLMIDQAGALETETTLVLFGLEPLENYVKNLQENIGLSSIQASVIAHDVNELIFKGIREILKNINSQILEKENIPTRETLISEIEQPEKIKINIQEPSISMSSLPSNAGRKPEVHPEMAKEGIEIVSNNLPEIAPKVPLPMVSIQTKPIETLHTNVSPVKNIVEAKLQSVIVTPKETIIIGDKTKLPEKPKTSSDPYRESVI